LLGLRKQILTIKSLKSSGLLCQETLAQTILEVIATSEGMLPIVLDLEFEFDELMCEGIYTLNLDNRTFVSTYEGITLVLTFDEIQAGLTNDDYVWAFTLEKA